jgi:hypothetical protein
VQTSAEERSQPFLGFRTEACLAEPDCVKAKRKRAIADLVLG